MSVATKARLAGRMTEIGVGCIKDAITRPKSTDPNVAPPSTAALTNPWLTGALCGQTPGAEVTGFTLGELDLGSNARQPLTVTYNPLGREAKLPTQMFAKFTGNFKQRLAGGLTGAAVSETGFYKELRADLGDIEAPIAYYGIAEPRQCRSMLLMEDLTGRVADFGDPAKHYIDRQRAESMVDLLARVHGGLWDDPRLRTDFPWLRSTMQFQRDLDGAMNFVGREQVGLDRAHNLSLVPDYVMKHRRDIHHALYRSLELNLTGPQTLIHFDVHLANWYITTTGSMGLMDWGCVVKGNWAIDFAYAIISALTVEDRRAWERELLERYLGKLADAGGAPPPLDEAWLRYRQQVFHGLTFWLVTIGYSRFQPKMQPDDVCEAIVERMSHALTDLGSFDALNNR